MMQPNRRSRYLADLVAVPALALAGCQANRREPSTPSRPKPAAPKPRKRSARSVELDPAMPANVKLEQVRERPCRASSPPPARSSSMRTRRPAFSRPLPGQVMDLRVRVGDIGGEGQRPVLRSRAAKSPAWSPISCRRSASRTSPRSHTP